MAPFFSLIKDLTPATTLWAMRVRLVRRYEVPAYGNKSEVASFEYIFQDKEGDRVHATARGQSMWFFKEKAVEGHLYALKDFIVTENRMKFRTTTHPLRIIFLRKTKMQEIFDENFPEIVHEFKAFKEIKESKEMLQFLLFDVIGRVVSCQLPPVTIAKGKRLEFTLQDNDDNKIDCTLWDDYILELLPFLETSTEESIIVMIEFGRASVFGDQVRFCNTYNVTKITVNGQTEAFKKYTKCLADSGCVGAALTTVASSSAPSIEEAFKSGKADVKNLAEIVHYDKDGVFWVEATIIQIETLREWCYLACSKCSKKLSNDGRSFLCTRCGVRDVRGQYRYKIEVLVNDGSAVAKFLLWDHECTELIGKTAADVIKAHPEAFDFVPPLIEEALYDRVGIFKVQVKECDQTRHSVTYNVTKLSADEKILGIYYNVYVDQKKKSSKCQIEEIIEENEKEQVVDEHDDDIPKITNGAVDSGIGMLHDVQEKSSKCQIEEINEENEKEQAVDEHEDDIPKITDETVDSGIGKKRKKSFENDK